ncbi:hypothetical protein D1AOALGA4SA_12219 [Olavius algarvensis Delta 1 endosymbiont]|nr:hypothetical protein D1AOALGA4SA_12219 [Olavius algarvensis Delta 1 endosymbiont]
MKEVQRFKVQRSRLSSFIARLKKRCPCFTRQRMDIRIILTFY